MPRRPLPEQAELRFIEATRTGKVHLAIHLPAHHPEATPVMSLAPVVTRCGKFTFPVGGRHQTVGRFTDAQLCGACYRTLTEADQPRAFEHDQPTA
ncbi:hypothetical protein [Streptomyces clavifer]|uniref:hypothetical protein n=1 Tax=Streptomyces clavifer TaxID=68188 RepID=UPI003092F98C|nr:hypothetical protein OG388_26785 [Streptomyces clavifer]